MNDNQIKIEKLQSVVDLIKAAKDNIVALLDDKLDKTDFENTIDVAYNELNNKVDKTQLESLEKVVSGALVDLNSRIDNTQTLIDGKVNINELSVLEAQLNDKQNKIDNRIDECESVTAHAITQIKESLGTNEGVNVSFSGTNNLDDCKSIIEAILKLDSLLKNN